MSDLNKLFSKLLTNTITTSLGKVKSFDCNLKENSIIYTYEDFKRIQLNISDLITTKAFIDAVTSILRNAYFFDDLNSFETDVEYVKKSIIDGLYNGNIWDFLSMVDDSYCE